MTTFARRLTEPVPYCRRRLTEPAGAKVHVRMRTF